jgi:hypothetical protein
MQPFTPAPWMRDEQERRQSLWRDLWAGRPLTRMPLDIRVAVPAAHSVRAQFRDGDAQLAVAMDNVKATWQLGTSTDTVPAMRPDVGCSCLATAYGAEYYWGESPNQTPGIRTPVVTDLEAQVGDLPQPDPRAHGWLPEGLRRIARFAEVGGGFVPVSLLDAAGGVNVAADLLGMTGLMLAFSTAPLALHRLLDSVQTLFIATIEAGIAAAGGEANITTTDFPDLWFPEGRKGHVSDDVSAGFGPATYAEFSAPYHARVFARFGAGGLHNCGPNPCHAEYLAHDPAPRALDLANRYSRADLPLLAVSLHRRGFVYLGFDGLPGTDCDPVAWYRGIVAECAPELIVVPVITVSSTTEGRELFAALAPVATEYAAKAEFGWMD